MGILLCLFSFQGNALSLTKWTNTPIVPQFQFYNHFWSLSLPHGDHTTRRTVLTHVLLAWGAQGLTHRRIYAPIFFPPTVNDSYSLLHRTSDVVPNQLKKLHRRHQFCVCVCECVCVCVCETERKRERRLQLPCRVPSGVSIRAALLISDSHCSNRARVQKIKPHISETGITKTKISRQIVLHKNQASVTEGNQK